MLLTLLQQKLRAAIAAFADQAERAGDALMPSYTHMRRAMPVLVSHFLLSHAAALRRDHHRLELAREEANALPLGSGAIAGTGYPVDTAALAARYPHKSTFFRAARLAVNHAFQPTGAPLRAGDEIAVIELVGGG